MRGEEHKLSNSIESLNKVAGKYGKRIGSMQSTSSLSRSSSLDSVSTVSSEAELLNPATLVEIILEQFTYFNEKLKF